MDVDAGKGIPSCIHDLTTAVTASDHSALPKHAVDKSNVHIQQCEYHRQNDQHLKNTVKEDWV